MFVTNSRRQGWNFTKFLRSVCSMLLPSQQWIWCKRSKPSFQEIPPVLSISGMKFGNYFPSGASLYMQLSWLFGKYFSQTVRRWRLAFVSDHEKKLVINLNEKICSKAHEAFGKLNDRLVVNKGQNIQMLGIFILLDEGHSELGASEAYQLAWWFINATLWPWRDLTSDHLISKRLPSRRQKRAIIHKQINCMLFLLWRNDKNETKNHEWKFRTGKDI